MKSEEAYFFVNSVREIKKILDKTNLTLVSFLYI